MFPSRYYRQPVPARSPLGNSPLRNPGPVPRVRAQSPEEDTRMTTKTIEKKGPSSRLTFECLIGKFPLVGGSRPKDPGGSQK
jgi:hypothetical protein